MRRWARGFVTAVVLLLAACETNFSAPENTSAFSVVLDVEGTTEQAENPDSPTFVVEWSHVESSQNGSAPVNPRFTPKEISPVPVGSVNVEMAEHPVDCVVIDTRQQVRVIRSDTVSVTFSAECES